MIGVLRRHNVCTDKAQSLTEEKEVVPPLAKDTYHYSYTKNEHIPNPVHHSARRGDRRPFWATCMICSGVDIKQLRQCG